MLRNKAFFGLVVGLLIVALTGIAAAQDGGLVFSPAPSGVEVTGSLTVDGVTYTAEEIQAWAAEFEADSSALPLDVPDPVRQAILDVARYDAAPGGTP